MILCKYNAQLLNRSEFSTIFTQYCGYQNKYGATALIKLLKYCNAELDESYNIRLYELYEKEKNIIDNNGWTPLMHLCYKDNLDSIKCLIISYLLRLFPELSDNPGDLRKWNKSMKMSFLIGGAKYVNLNHPEFQQVWWDAREEISNYGSVLLIHIA